MLGPNLLAPVGALPRPFRKLQTVLLADGPTHRADELRLGPRATEQALGRGTAAEIVAKVLASATAGPTILAHRLQRRLTLADDIRRAIALTQGAPIRRGREEARTPAATSLDAAIAVPLASALSSAQTAISTRDTAAAARLIDHLAPPKAAQMVRVLARPSRHIADVGPLGTGRFQGPLAA